VTADLPDPSDEPIEQSDLTDLTDLPDPADPERSTDPEVHRAQRVEGAPNSATTAEGLALACFLIAAAAAITLAVVYWRGGQPQLEGVLLAVATGGIGIGIIVWAKRFMPDDEVAEDRHPLTSSEPEIEALRTDFEHGEQTLVGRRRLVRAIAAALAALGAALLFPIRSLGPRPGRGLKFTAYADAEHRKGGVRLVRADDRPIKPRDLEVDGVLTVFPEGHTDDADAPTLLIHTRPQQKLELADDRDRWVVGGIIAFSKLCTHVGCPVGLYQAGEGLLLCPCHQSTFNVLEGAKPIFGPAARSLPQLPLAVDDEGYLIATGDFSSPVGPGFWDRSR
jgi:ubiquinol-cytochrome c reductase iron-sulfur subunit